MIAVDLAEHRLLVHTRRSMRSIAARAPFKHWLREGVIYLESHLIDPGLAAEPFRARRRSRDSRNCSALTREERDIVLTALAEVGVEATGSMGDDTPSR